MERGKEKESGAISQERRMGLLYDSRCANTSHRMRQTMSKILTALSQFGINSKASVFLNGKSCTFLSLVLLAY